MALDGFAAPIATIRGIGYALEVEAGVTAGLPA